MIKKKVVPPIWVIHGEQDSVVSRGELTLWIFVRGLLMMTVGSGATGSEELLHGIFQVYTGDCPQRAQDIIHIAWRA